MVKDMGLIYKHSQYQLSTLSLKTSVSSSPKPQKSPAIEFTTKPAPYVTEKHQNNYILCSQNTIQNDSTITNNDDIQSCETPRKQHYIIPIISTPNNNSQYIASTYSSRLNFNTPTILPPVGKECMCFMKEGKYDQAVRCIKSSIMTKVIAFFLSIDTFEQQFAVLKGMLQSLRLKDHLQTIGIEQYLSNNAIYEHKCLENIKKIYKHAGKCDNQKQFKDIPGAAMVYTPEGFTDCSPISPMTSAQVKKPSARKSLCLFTNILEVKKKTATRRVGAAKYKRKSIKFGNTPWALKQNRKGNSKIDEQIKKSLYNWIMRHPQVVQSPIVNDCLKVNIDGHTEPQLVPKLLLYVSVREVRKSLANATIVGDLKEAIDEDDNIIISDSTLLSLLLPQLIFFVKYKVMCGF